MNYIIIFFIIFFSSCTIPSIDILVINSGETQGTFYHIQYISDSGKDYNIQIDSLLSEIDSSLSTYKDFSIISRINNGEKVKINKMFSDVFKAAGKVYFESDGEFDCSIAPLTNYWGYGPNEELLEIDSVEVLRRLSLVDYSKISIVNDSIFLPVGMQLDFNSIAQGYSVDLVSDFLLKYGITNYLVEIGGEIQAHGKNSDYEFWTVGIDKPLEKIDLEDRFQFIISLENSSLATSGNYRKFKEINGVKYSHTISTKTGFFAENRMLSATVIHPSCMFADAYATAFMSMGVRKSKEFIINNPHMKVYFVYSNLEGEKKIFTSGNLDIN